MSLMRTDIELHIEELVLEGFAPGDRHAIGEAVRAELTRLLAEQRAPQFLQHGGETARLDGGKFDLKAGARSEAVGVQVARTVYEGFGK